MAQMRRFGAATENVFKNDSWGKAFKKNRVKAFSCLGANLNAVSFNLANHLPGAAVVAGCAADGTLLGSIAASPLVVTVAVIMLLVVGVMAVISCFGLSLGVKGS